MPESEPEQQFLEAEHLVELHSAELKKELRKELRLGDLVLSQILYITGLFGINAAGALYFWRASKRRKDLAAIL